MNLNVAHLFDEYDQNKNNFTRAEHIEALKMLFNGLANAKDEQYQPEGKLHWLEELHVRQSKWILESK